MSHSPLGSLSSPSPSPSPPPNPLDESELSELTDDDHDEPPPTQRQRQRQVPQRSAATPSSKRRKRGGLVPAPMWDWAYKNGTAGEEEEEEEEEEEDIPTPPRAMEEEEGEDPGPAHRKRRQRRRTDIVVPLPLDYAKIPRSKRGIKITSQVRDDMLIKNLWEKGFKFYDPNAPSSDEDNRYRNPSLASFSDDMSVDDDSPNSKITPPNPTTTDPLSVPPSVRASVDPTISPPDDDHVDDPPQDRDEDDEDGPPEDPSQPPSPTPLPEPEPEPEQEQEDEDPDLQPAHRAEALDVLATIELKFALLRERVYVEKMEGLAWEETLVWDGTHPELHHLQDELTTRRDKRLMLASKKRGYEIDGVTRKRREQETWCWEAWDLARTELQTEMMADTNRKRRKLERERRTIERPPGARRIPSAILNPPPAPTLRQIANTFPLPSHLSHLAANKRLSCAKGLGAYPGLDGLGGVTAYPDLATLSPHEIAADLEFLFQHRRLGYGFGMGFVPPIGVPIGVGYNSATPGFGPGFGGHTPTPGFGVIGPGDGPPPNSGPTAPAPLQNTSNTLAAPTDGPAMGVFQGPPGPAYPVGSGSGASVVIGPGGTTSTPVMGPGGTRIQRPSGFVERERELMQRDRELRERELTPRELAAQRERERERELGPPWNSKPPDWDARQRNGDRDRDKERSQVQPIVPTPTHRHLHHPHHPFQQHPPHQSHSHHPPHPPPHGHPHQQHGTSHAPPHHHVGQHHHHRHHHHVLHHHHPGSGTSSSGPDGVSQAQSSGCVQSMEMFNVPSSKSHWKRDEAKLGGNSMPGSRPSSTHPLPPPHGYDERERDRPIATPFVLAPSHHTISSTASSPRHGWTSESGPNTFPDFHTPVPHRFSNAGPNGLSQLPRPLTTSPPRGPPSTTSPSLNAPLAPSSTSTGPFPLPRKPSPALPKLNMPLGYSPRLAGPGVVPPTGPGVPGVLSTTSNGGPGVTPSGIFTSGPGVPPGPGIAPAPSGEGGPSLFARTTSPLVPYTAPVVTSKVGVEP